MTPSLAPDLAPESSASEPKLEEARDTETFTSSLGSSLAMDAAWNAVEARDGQFDGAFVYAVCSTKIYCRPSCPSRRPLRRNVQFFAGPKDAEHAGFRACRRCRPQGHLSPVVDLVRRAADFLDARYEDAPSLGDVAAHVKIGPAHLQKTFRRLTGLSPAAYVEGRRMQRLRAELESGTSVTDSIYAAGFSSPSRVYEKSNSLLGMSPGTYRDGGRGVRIYHAVVDCELGRLLVAATEKGICTVELGDDPAALVARLHDRFPKADIVGDSEALSDWIEDVVALQRGAEPTRELPLDLRGTAFQRQVWNALRRIPKGTTRTYKEIAEALGRPRAARAVAGACAGNTVALVIPCHRVIRGDGGLGGYRWGIERKERLLELESSARDAELPEDDSDAISP